MSRMVPADVDTAANLPADVAYTDVNNTFTVAQTLSGAITGALLQVNNSSTIGAGVLIGSTSVASAGAGKTAPALALTQTTPATANYGLVSIGGGAWDGAAAGHFVGDTNGTKIAVNATSGFTGKLLDLQVNGTSKIWIGNTGNVLLTNIVQLSDSGFNFSGTTSVLSRNNSTGAITFQLQNVSGATYSTVSGHASAIPQIIKGAASQSADLQQWQNSSATVLANVDANGNVFSSVTGSTTSSPRTIGFLNLAAGTAARFQVDSSNGFQSAYGNSTQVYSNLTLQLIGGNGGAAPSFSSWTGIGTAVVNTNAANIGLVCRGAASQSADLQQWQDSTGSAVLSVSLGTFGGGYINSVNTNGVQLNCSNASNRLSVQNGWADNVTETAVQIDHSSTHNVSIFGGVAGSVLTMNRLQFSSLHTSFYTGSQASTPAPAATVEIINASGQAAQLGLLVKGATSQTADLQQWQNSAGTVLTNITSVGTILAPAIGAVGQTNGSYIAFVNGSPVTVNTATGSVVGLVVKPFSGAQTADLQQWQNSSATVLAKVDATGAFNDSTGVGSGARLSNYYCYS